MNIRECNVYSFRYKSIAVEIRKWKEEWRDKDSWAHYIYIPEEAIPPEFKDKIFLSKDIRYPEDYEKYPSKKYMPYSYMDSFLANLDWHGGITYYDKLGGIDGRPMTVKAGCDYQHYHDEDVEYDINYIIQEAKWTVDSLHKLIPTLKVRCNYNGKYYDPTEVKEWGDGYISNEGQEALNKEKIKT